MSDLVTVQLAEPYLLIRGTDTDISVALEQYGTPVTVTTATATVYDEQGNQVAQYTDTSTTAPTVTVLGADTTSAILSERWRVEWDLDGRVINTAAQLVRYGWTPALTDADLYRRAPALDPSGVSPISERLTYEPERTEAIHQVRDRMLSNGRRPWLVVEPHRLREPLVLLTLALVFEGFAHRDTLLHPVADRYREQFERAWDSLSFLYDDTEDGNADSDSRTAARPSAWLQALN